MQEFKGGKYKYASIKRDGHSTSIQFTNGGIQVYSRSGLEITRKVSWTEWFHTLKHRLDGCRGYGNWCGELWVPGHGASYVPTAMRLQDPALRFTVWGVGHLKSGRPFEEVQEEARAVGLECIEFCEFGKEDAFKCLPDVEGFVFSNGNLQDYVKLKPMRSADLVVQGWKEGTGKYRDLVGALEVGTFDGEPLATISGMTDKIRREITANPFSYIGKVVEVQYQCVGEKGRLRHPVFKGFRDDKPAEECSIEQVR